jgi:hypothetical protein
MAHGVAPEVAARTEAAVVAALGQRSVVLVGMMGSGKTSVGERVAARLGRRLLDSDAVIEERTGRTVREIFETQGEAAFRRLEAAVLDEALASLPAPQRRALSRALLLDDEGPPPDPHAIGVAVLNALRALAATGPVVVAVDDVQWLDPASAGALAYDARRLRAEQVGVMLARRIPRRPFSFPSCAVRCPRRG